MGASGCRHAAFTYNTSIAWSTLDPSSSDGRADIDEPVLAAHMLVVAVVVGSRFRRRLRQHAAAVRLQRDDGELAALAVSAHGP